MTVPGPWPAASGPTPPQPFGPPPNYGPGGPPQWGAPPPWGPPASWGPPAQPPPGVPPYGWYPPPPKRSRLKWVIAALVAAIAAAGAVGIWSYRHYQHEQQLAHIRETINAFAEASDTADTTAMASLMCREEAAEFTDGFEGSADDGPIEPAQRRAVDIGAINITRDEATVEVTRSPTPAVTLKLKREGGDWKLCNPG